MMGSGVLDGTVDNLVWTLLESILNQ